MGANVVGAASFHAGGAVLSGSLPRPTWAGRLTRTTALAARTLVAAATVGMLLLVAAVMGPMTALGWHPYVVYTGSMEPAIRTGSVILVQPVPFDRLVEGDVITFARPQNPGMPVTHRVVGLARDMEKGTWQITTKGDANAETDVWTVSQEQVVGRTVYAVPAAGYILVWLAAPFGKQLVLAFIALSFVAHAVAGRVRRARDSAGAGAPPAPLPCPAQ